jgi:hypothetical protein
VSVVAPCALDRVGEPYWLTIRARKFWGRPVKGVVLSIKAVGRVVVLVRLNYGLRDYRSVILVARGLLLSSYVGAIVDTVVLFRE